MEKLYKDGYRTNDEGERLADSQFYEGTDRRNALGLSLPLTEVKTMRKILKMRLRNWPLFGYDTETESGGFIDSIIMEKQVMPEGEELAMTGSSNAAPLSVPVRGTATAVSP